MSPATPFPNMTLNEKALEAALEEWFIHWGNFDEPYKVQCRGGLGAAISAYLKADGHEPIEGDVEELVARLKALATCPPEQVYPVDYEWFGIAADRIDTLTAENERLTNECAGWENIAETWTLNIATLTAENAEMKEKVRDWEEWSDFYKRGQQSQQREIYRLCEDIHKWGLVVEDQQREIERLKEAFALQAQIWEREFRARCKLETDLYLTSGAAQEKKDER